MRNPNTSQTRGFSSSSSSSSRSYSPSSSSSVLPHTPTTRTMDQVWKDLTLFPPPPPISHLHHPNPNPNPSSNPNPNPSSSFRRVILQDFLAGPFKDSSAASQMPCELHNEDQFALPPQTALSLNSSALDHFDQYHHRHSQNNISGSAHDHENGRDHDNIDPPFVPAAAFSDAGAVGLFSFCPNKRAVIESSCGDGGDRRHKRMMKNRESAARSRARKQAHLSLSLIDHNLRFYSKFLLVS